MAKKGLSVRERGEMGYLSHCYGFASDLLSPSNWIEWDAVKDGAVAVLQFFAVLLIIIMFPVSIPLIGWLRHRHAVKTLTRESAYYEGVKARVQSRVQKV